MNASGVAAMEPQKSPKGSKKSDAPQSRGDRMVAAVTRSSKPVLTKSPSQRWEVGEIGLIKPNPLAYKKKSEAEKKLEQNQKLIKAIKLNDLSEVLQLLFHEADVNFCDAEFNTPLLCAIFSSLQEDQLAKDTNYLIVHKLLEYKADVNPYWNNPLQAAQLMGNSHIKQLLIKYGAKKHQHIGNIPQLCECVECFYRLKEEQKKDQKNIRFFGFLRTDLGIDSEDFEVIKAKHERKEAELALLALKEEEERKKKMVARVPRKPPIIMYQNGIYSDPNNPPGRLDALMDKFRTKH